MRIVVVVFLEGCLLPISLFVRIPPNKISTLPAVSSGTYDTLIVHFYILFMTMDILVPLCL